MNTPTQPPKSDAALLAQRQALSDLMDGSIDAGGASAACRAWRLDAQTRQDWHAYQVIGDVLRTPELAPRGAVADAAFLAALRTRLAQEPVVMAPAAAAHSSDGLAAASGNDFGSRAAPTSAASTSVASTVSAQPSKRRTGWRNTMAVAAGFAAVAVVVNGLPWGTGPAAGPELASAPKAATPTAVLSAARSPATATAPAQAAAPVMLVNDQRMVRDAQLDRYLSAHRQFGGAPAMALPGGVIRSVSATAPER
jgi:sigma-E factor negative regulatory protein RseA